MVPPTSGNRRVLLVMCAFVALVLPRPSYSQTLLANSSATPISVLAADTVTVQVSGGPANQYDWIGVFSSGSLDSQWLDWRYLSGTRQAPSSGLSSASLGFMMPTSLGVYTIRLFSGASGALLATGPTITVTGSGVQGLSLSFGVSGVPSIDPSAIGSGADGALVLTAPFN